MIRGGGSAYYALDGLRLPFVLLAVLECLVVIMMLLVRSLAGGR